MTTISPLALVQPLLMSLLLTPINACNLISVRETPLG